MASDVPSGAGHGKAVELDAGLDGRRDDRIDRGQAEPERRDADQGADRQVDARAGALGGGGFGDSEACDGLGHSVPLRRHPAGAIDFPVGSVTLRPRRCCAGSRPATW